MLETLCQAQSPLLLLMCRWPTGWKRRWWRMLVLVTNTECSGVQSFKVTSLSGGCAAIGNMHICAVCHCSGRGGGG